MAPTERLLWTGRPPQGLRFRRQDLPTMLFGSAWTGFALYWTWSVWQEEQELTPVLFGASMVLVGLHQFVGRFFVESYARARTWYGVSDSRVVIVTEAPVRSVESVPLAELPEVVLQTEGIDGGIIQFGGEVEPVLPALGESRRPRRRGSRRSSRPQGPRLELETGARSACEIIRRAQHDAKRPRDKRS